LKKRKKKKWKVELKEREVKKKNGEIVFAVIPSPVASVCACFF
jgi:hypothetical protein